MLHKRRSLLLGDIASPGVQYASDDDEIWHDLYCHQSKTTNLTMKALEIIQASLQWCLCVREPLHCS